MRMFKRGISALLLLCMILTMLPPVQFARAAEITQRYELDTDGIDVGAQYLIVSSGAAGNANALRFYYEGWTRDFENQTLTVRTDTDGIRYIDTGFSNEEDCRFTFSAANAGAIRHGDYYVDLSDAQYSTSAPGNTLTFSNQGGGAYRISYSSWWINYYLRCNNAQWGRSTTATNVYLYKLVENVVGYDVIYDGNGYTAGELPQNAQELSNGQEYTVEEPLSELRKDVGEETYLFRCWNTAADGTGTEYAPGEVLTVNGDITLYAQWYQQIKYTVTVTTDLDDVHTDVTTITGREVSFYIKSDAEGSAYIPLTRTADGTYSAQVVDNGTYAVYTKRADGSYHETHGHVVVIFNQSGSTECLHYSVSYDANGGVWAEGEAPSSANYHAKDPAFATDKIPTRQGSRFLGWEDQNGNLIAPGAQITDSIMEKTVLTARWEETVGVTVHVRMNHVAPGGESAGVDHSDTKSDVSFVLMRTDAEGYNHPVGEITLTPDSCSGEGYRYIFSESAGGRTGSYTAQGVTFSGLQAGAYTVAASKHYYEATVTSQTDAAGNVTVDVFFQYSPSTFDLNFDVIIDDWQNVPQQLRPQAVNIKVSGWGYDANDVLSWHVITQQEGTNPPVSVTIDPATGAGSGFFPVWKYWPSDDGTD